MQDCPQYNWGHQCCWKNLRTAVSTPQMGKTVLSLRESGPSIYSQVEPRVISVVAEHEKSLVNTLLRKQESAKRDSPSLVRILRSIPSFNMNLQRKYKNNSGIISQSSTGNENRSFHAHIWAIFPLVIFPPETKLSLFVTTASFKWQWQTRQSFHKHGCNFPLD